MKRAQRIVDFRITRFQFARDRVIGDSQVMADDVNIAAIELIADDGNTGLGFAQAMFLPLPEVDEIVRIFKLEVWPLLEGQSPAGLVHRVSRPRGGNQRPFTLNFHEALQVALWDLHAKGCGLPLWQVLGGQKDSVPAYASGLDFHLSDADYVELFGKANELGYSAFKIKVGHVDFARDMHRIDLLRKTVRPHAQIMIDANEAWGAKQALNNLETIRHAGIDLLWVEDPILRNDFAGLRMLRDNTPWTLINSGEYLDASGKRQLLDAGGTDILNVHGPVTDVMRIGWYAHELGIPLSIGNTFLEVGIHVGVALPEIHWLEYSFQNYDFLVDQPIAIRDGRAWAPDRPGHGLVLSETARLELSQATLLARRDLPPAIPHPQVGKPI